jgi:hypothetical protein
MWIWHPAILETIKKRDVKGAESILREHLQEIILSLKELSIRFKTLLENRRFPIIVKQRRIYHNDYKKT